MINTMASFVILLIARTARIACADRQTYIHTDTHTRDNYCNPRCACAPRVNYTVMLLFISVYALFLQGGTHVYGASYDQKA